VPSAFALNLPAPPRDKSLQSRAIAVASAGGFMPIRLQGTLAFEPGFVKKLPKLEQAMVAQGLEPSSFVISKDFATPATMPIVGPFFYDYTVFVGDDYFTVTEPNDLRFLGYLIDRVLAPEPEPLRKAKTLLARFTRFMALPI
jgi:hypothetical protein